MFGPSGLRDKRQIVREDRDIRLLVRRTGEQIQEDRSGEAYGPG